MHPHGPCEHLAGEIVLVYVRELRNVGFVIRKALQVAGHPVMSHMLSEERV